MPVTQAMNPKANVKKFTNNDLPFSSQQPVMSSYYAVSTAGQTVINLSFSVDTVNLTDQFFLFVDGKKLRLGASNDYTFTSIGSDNRSSQVTLTSGIASNLNIQAYQLGLKSEVEFGTDNRFTQLYEAESAGFQSFISTSTQMSATQTTGTPVAGTFYSSIFNRSSMIDMTQDLRANLGIDRLTIGGLYLMQSESGPNGELVYGAANDSRNQIRFVGGSWSLSSNTGGQQVQTGTNLTDFVEITFYGTGLNVLTFLNTTSFDARASLDGGAEGANILPSGSPVLNGRNANLNTVVPVYSGLTLGVHTVKIRCNNVNSWVMYGFEVLNESTTLKINPGVGYAQAKKLTLASQLSFAPNVMATGTKGGRAVVYQTGSTVASAWNAVNATQQNLTNTTHVNEELVRSYGIREFGANSASDFTTMINSNDARTFTLEDGTTTLQCFNSSASITGPADGLTLGGTGAYAIFTFVGTGLDLVQRDTASGTLDTHSVTIDGTNVGNLSTVANSTQRMTRIVSGLPYGTHTVQLLRTTAVNQAMGIVSLQIYQPKKPAVPVGAVELADYNVMANYVGIASASKQNIGTGLLRKTEQREMVYVGTWGMSGNIPTSLNGFNVSTSTNGDYVEYTFFGTGVSLNVFATSGTVSTTIQIDGLAYTGAATAVGTSTSWTAGTSTFVVGSQVGSQLQINGLTLGAHKVRITTSANAANTFNFNGLDIVTPIHAVKSATTFDFGNSLSTGSQTVGDTRKLTPLRDSAIPSKNVSVAYGISSNPSTSSSAFIPVPDMYVSHTNRTGKIKISYTGRFSNNTTGAGTVIAMFLNGVAVGQAKVITPSTGTMDNSLADFIIVNVSPGTHQIQLQWFAGAGAAIATGNARILMVEEI